MDEIGYDSVLVSFAVFPCLTAELASAVSSRTFLNRMGGTVVRDMLSDMAQALTSRSSVIRDLEQFDGPLPVEPSLIRVWMNSILLPGALAASDLALAMEVRSARRTSCITSLCRMCAASCCCGGLDVKHTSNLYNIDVPMPDVFSWLHSNFVQVASLLRDFDQVDNLAGRLSRAMYVPRDRDEVRSNTTGDLILLMKQSSSCSLCPAATAAYVRLHMFDARCPQ